MSQCAYCGAPANYARTYGYLQMRTCRPHTRAARETFAAYREWRARARYAEVGEDLETVFALSEPGWQYVPRTERGARFLEGIRQLNELERGDPPPSE